MKVLVLGPLLVTAARGDSCTAAQMTAMLAKVNDGMGSMDDTKYASVEAFTTAARAAIGTLAFPCANCLEPYLSAFYDAHGTDAGVCSVSDKSSACQQADAVMETTFALCMTTGDASSAHSAAIAAVALIAASCTLL